MSAEASPKDTTPLSEGLQSPIKKVKGSVAKKGGKAYFLLLYRCMLLAPSFVLSQVIKGAAFSPKKVPLPRVCVFTASMMSHSLWCVCGVPRFTAPFANSVRKSSKTRNGRDSFSEKCVSGGEAHTGAYEVFSPGEEEHFSGDFPGMPGNRRPPINFACPSAISETHTHHSTHAYGSR